MFPVSFGFYTDCQKGVLHLGAWLSRGESGKGDRNDIDTLSALAQVYYKTTTGLT